MKADRKITRITKCINCECLKIESRTHGQTGNMRRCYVFNSERKVTDTCIDEIRRLGHIRSEKVSLWMLILFLSPPGWMVLAWGGYLIGVLTGSIKP